MRYRNLEVSKTVRLTEVEALWLKRRAEERQCTEAELLREALREKVAREARVGGV